MFSWKTIFNGIPIKKNLDRCNICSDSLCPHYGEKDEDVLHAIGRCAEARQMWYCSSLRLTIPEVIGTFKEWIRQLIEKDYGELWWETFRVIAWLNWGSRNKAFPKGKIVQVQDTLAKISYNLLRDGNGGRQKIKANDQKLLQ